MPPDSRNLDNTSSGVISGSPTRATDSAASLPSDPAAEPIRASWLANAAGTPTAARRGGPPHAGVAARGAIRARAGRRDCIGGSGCRP